MQVRLQAESASFLKIFISKIIFYLYCLNLNLIYQPLKLIILFFNLQVTPLQWRRSVSGSDYGTRGMGVLADPGSFRWCQALSRSRSFATKSTSNQHLPTIKSSFAGKQIKQNYRSNYYVALLIIIAILTKQTIANNINPGEWIRWWSITKNKLIVRFHH